MLSNGDTNTPAENPETEVTIHPAGSVAEWSIATVLKTVDSQGSVSSNLTASAKYSINKRLLGAFLLPILLFHLKLRIRPIKVHTGPPGLRSDD